MKDAVPDFVKTEQGKRNRQEKEKVQHSLLKFRVVRSAGEPQEDEEIEGVIIKADTIGGLEALRNLRIEVTEGPISLILNGLQEVVQVRLQPNGPQSVSRFEAWLAQCFNEGIRVSRKAAKEEIERITGWTIPEIPGLT